MSSYHTAVMAAEAMELLAVAPGKRYCDATVGGAGHARELLERSAPDGQLVGLDRDPEALQHCREELSCYGARVTLCRGNFADLVQILTQLGMAPVDGVLVDLGVSSHQLDDARRGFSFSTDGPLDMRMDPSAPTAAELISRLSEEELAAVIRDLGEEPSSRRIARAIKRAQERGALRGTSDLARVVSEAVGGRSPRGGKIHPATRTFMALRLAVNEELASLDRFLDTFTEALRPGGRVAVIAFHSLEDRAVKKGLARLARPCVCPPGLPICGCGRQPVVRPLTGRPLRPSAVEIASNPRARSARLRAAERV
jgi:16S rRNA (cytosine1402-N4)-methyltransferase